MSHYQIGTNCLHAGYRPGNGEPRNFPIVQSTTFRYETSEEMGKLFDLEASGYFYTRLQNPTNDTVAAKICALEGGSAAMLLSSGQAANFYAIFNIAGCGDHIISSTSIYGGTFNLFSVTMKRMGVEFSFVEHLLSEELDALDEGDADRAEEAARTRERFLSQHLGRWAYEYAKEMKAAAQTGFYRGIAVMIMEAA